MEKYKNLLNVLKSLLIFVIVFFCFRWFVSLNNNFLNPNDQLAQVISAPSSGLIGYWMLDEGSGSNASDSASGNSGNVIGSHSWIAGKINNALSLNGTSDYVSIPYNSNYNFTASGAFTASAWIKANSVNSLQFILQQSYGNKGWFLGINSSGSLTSTYNFPNYGGVTGGSISSGSWYHVAFVCNDGTSAKLYINGSLSGSGTCGTPTMDPTPITIGADTYGGNYFNGSIDDVRIYNRALSSSEVSQLASYTGSGTTPPTTPPVITTPPVVTTPPVTTLPITTIPSVGSTYFIRPGGTGNGSNWTNAAGNFNNIPWIAGETVCLAGGTYNQTLIPTGSGTASAPIIVKRAYASDTQCGNSATGWNSAYDSFVIISNGTSNAMTLNTNGLSYITIDGKYLNSSGKYDIGMRLVTPNSDGSSISIDNSVNNITFTYLDLAGPGGSSPINMNGDNRGIDATAWASVNNGAYSYQPINYLTLSHSIIHGQVNNLWLMNVNNSTFEYNKFYDSGAANSTTYHANVIATANSKNITFRYNEIYNHQVEGIMFIFGGAANWYVYGNLWHDGMTGVSRVLEVQDGVEGPIYFYNNTVSNITMSLRTANSGSFASGSQDRNNIYWNSAGPTSDSPEADYDLSNVNLGQTHGITLSSTPFASNYHLNATNNGQSLSYPYNSDMDGNTRGYNGAWSIGAFQYTGTNTGGGNVITSPSTYTITPTVGTNGSITPSSITTVTSGGSQTFSINPNSGYQIAGVMVDGLSRGAITSYTFANVITNHTISATFSVIPAVVTPPVTPPATTTTTIGTNNGTNTGNTGGSSGGSVGVSSGGGGGGGSSTSSATPSTPSVKNAVTTVTTVATKTNVVTSTTTILSTIRNLPLFTKILKQGMTNADVKNLQIFLNNSGYTVSVKGAGSKGSETTYFGKATAAAVSKFQIANKTLVLAPYGLTTGTGNFGLMSYKTANSIIRTGVAK